MLECFKSLFLRQVFRQQSARIELDTYEISKKNKHKSQNSLSWWQGTGAGRQRQGDAMTWCWTQVDSKVSTGPSSKTGCCGRFLSVQLNFIHTEYFEVLSIT